MQYSPEQFFALAEEVARQGGQHIDATCPAKEYQFVGPKGQGKTLVLRGCGNQTLFDVEYATEVPGTNAAVLNIVEMCAVCDDMGEMPRFKHAVPD